MGKIRANDAGFSGTRKSEGEITGSTAEIENQRIGAVEDGLQTPCGARAPETIELQRQEMIEQIVSRRDLGEHLAAFFRSVGFGNRALGARSVDRRGGLSHGALAKACYPQ